MKEVKISLYTIALILFVSNYTICDFFYYNEEIKDIKKWWALRSNICAVIIMLVFYASLIGTKGVLRLILSIMILLTICISLYDYLNTYKI